MGACCSCWTSCLPRWRARVRQAPCLLRNANLSIRFAVRIKCTSFAEEFEFIDKEIGTGASGAVLLARPRGQCCRQQNAAHEGTVAVKTVTMIDSIVNEADVHLRVDHPNIVRLYCVFAEEPNSTRLVMEYCSGGSLSDRLMHIHHFEEHSAMAISRQVLKAVNYLHRHSCGRLCHRDLKHSNFVFEDLNPEATLKLIDFGLSIILTDQRPSTSEYVGTLYYMAPEVILRQQYTEACDNWSVGVIIYYMLSGRPPFFNHTKTATIDAIVRGQPRPLDDPFVSVLAQTLVLNLLVVDAETRLTAQDALADPWFWVVPPSELTRATLRSLRRYAGLPLTERILRVALMYMSGPTQDGLPEALDAFAGMDLDCDGKISLADFENAWGNAGFAVDAECLDVVFKSIDADNDGYIEHTEFLAATRVADTMWEDRRLTSKIFSNLNEDGSDRVSKEDLRKLIGNAFAGHEVNEIFEAIDVNGSGFFDFRPFYACETSDARGG